MNLAVYLEIIYAYILFVLTIIVFKLLGIDLNFIVTFILAIFTLGISIFFFIESNKVYSTMQERLSLILEKVGKIKSDEEKVYQIRTFSGNINPKIKYDTEKQRKIERFKSFHPFIKSGRRKK